MSEANCVYVRPSLRDLREIPLDTDSALQAIAALLPLQRGVWFALRTHLWLYGQLPATPKQLAAIAGVTPRTFEKMAPSLAPLFDRDSAGRWRDLDLEEEREKRLDLEPGERPAALVAEYAASRAVDPDLSEKRRRAGTKGSDKRWGDRRQRLTLVAGGRSDDNLAPSAVSSSMANAIANEMANGGAASGFQSADLPSEASSGVASASGSHSPSDRLSSSFCILEEIEESDGRTDVSGAGAPAGKTDPAADGKTTPVATASAVPADAPDMANAMANPPRDLMASASAFGLANGAATSRANETALPYTVGEALGAAALPTAPPAAASHTDATVIEALVKAGGDKISSSLLTPAGIAPVRAWLASGADLTRHIMPAVAECTRALSEPLRSLNAGFLRQAVDAHRDRDRGDKTRAGAPLSDAFASKVFVVVDTPQWRAWCEHKRKRTMHSFQRESDRRWGTYFDSEWPPGADPARYGVKPEPAISG